MFIFLLFKFALSENIITRWNFLDNDPSGGVITGEWPGAWQGILGASTSSDSDDPTYTPSRGYYFDGNDFVSITPGAFTIPTSLYTVQAWVCPGVLNGDHSVILGKASQDPARSEDQWSFGFQSGAVMVWFHDDFALPPNYLWDGNTSAALVNKWSHFAASVQGTTITIYENGQSLKVWDATSFGSWNDNAANEIYVSMEWDSGVRWGFITGFVAEVKMTDIVISDFSSTVCTVCSAWGSTTCSVCEVDWLCRSICTLGTYPDYATKTCKSCSGGSCTNSCSGDPQSCNKCYGLYWTTWTGPDPTDCSACDTGYVIDPTQGCIAITCHASCNTCSGTTENDCSACYTNATLDPDPGPGKWECPGTGFYGTAQNCLAWDSSWNTCTGGNANQWVSCHSNASISSGSCVCDDGWTGSPNSCQACNAVCKTCQGITENECLTCYTNAALNSTPGKWECPSTGFYGTAQSCLAWDSSWQSCTSGTQSDWTQCHVGSELLNGTSPGTWVVSNTVTWSANASLVNGACICDDGWTGDPISCLQCSSNCKTCSGTSDSQCQTCYTNAAIPSGAAPGKWECSTTDAFYGTAQFWLPCDSTCATWSDSGSNKCLSWKVNAQIVDGTTPGTCTCSAGFYGSADNCQPCEDPLCSDWSSHNQWDSCVSNAELDVNTCKCSSGYILDTDSQNSCRQDCYGYCATWASTTTNSYTDWTSCRSISYSQTFGVSKSFCTDYCPTGYDDSSAQPSCLPPVWTNLESYAFNVPGPWTGFYSNITASISLWQTGQGVYFNEKTNQPNRRALQLVDPVPILQISAYKLPIHFTLSSWVYLFSNTKEQTLFAKDNNGLENQTYLRVFIQSNSLLSCSLMNAQLTKSQIFQDAKEFPQYVWEQWAISVQMNDDAVSSTIRFIMGTSDYQSANFISSSNIYFIDQPDGGHTYIGTGRDASKTHINQMYGLVYSLSIERGFYSKGDAEMGFSMGLCVGCSMGDTCVESQCLPCFWSDLSAPDVQWECEKDVISLEFQFLCIDTKQAEQSIDEKLSQVQKSADNSDLDQIQLEEILKMFSDDILQASDDERQRMLDIVDDGVKHAVSNTNGDISIATDNIEGAFVVVEPKNTYFETKILVESGSGIHAPADLDTSELDTDLLQFNVILVKETYVYESDEDSKDPDKIPEEDEYTIHDIVSVEVYHVSNDGASNQPIPFSNMTTNFTIIFENLDLNVTNYKEWVYREQYNTHWSTDGCWLSKNTSSYAEWEWNHLSQFSVKEYATPKSNRDAVTNPSLDNFEFGRNMDIIIWIIAIYFVFFVGLVITLKNDRQSSKIHENKIRSIQAMGHAITAPPLFSTNRELSLSQQASPSETNREFGQSSKNVSLVNLDEHAFFDSQLFQKRTRQDEFVSVPADATYSSGAKISVTQPGVEISIASNLEMINEDDTVEQKSSDESAGPDGKSSVLKVTPSGTADEEKTAKNIFIQQHLLLSVLCDERHDITRAERWIILFTIFMLNLFAIGLFYDADRDKEQEQEEKDKSIQESLESFGIKNVVIVFYSFLITFSVPFILKLLFARKVIIAENGIAKIHRAIICQRVNQIIAYILVVVTTAWCTYSCIAFSLEFGYNTTQIWLITYLITKIADVFLKEPMLALIVIWYEIKLHPILDEKCFSKCKKNCLKAPEEVKR